MTLILGTKEVSIFQNFGLVRRKTSIRSDNIFADYIATDCKEIIKGVNYCAVPPNTNKKDKYHIFAPLIRNKRDQ